jgi:CBS domain-containing protein
MTNFYINPPRLALCDDRSSLPNRKPMPAERDDIHQLRVRDLMTTALISVSPEAPLREIAATLANHRISSVPVIDNTDRLVGIVSEGDLFRRVELATQPPRTWWRSMFSDAMSTAHAYVRSHGRKARDVMTAHPVTSSPDEPLHKLAARMARKRLKRVPVVRNGRVVGLIARSDLVRQLAHQAAPSASPGDEALRNQIKEGIEKLPRNLQIRLVNIEVEDGVASLYGWATSAIEKRAVEVAAENVPGVVKVRNCVLPALPYV